MMPTDELLDRIAMAVTVASRVTLAELRDQGRTARAMNARRAFAALAVERGCCTKEIGAFLRHNEQTARYWLDHGKEPAKVREIVMTARLHLGPPKPAA